MKRKSIKVTCEICGAPTRNLVDPQLKVNKRPLEYAVCNTCGFTKKEPLALLEDHAEKNQYDFHQNTMENEGYKAMLNAFIDEAVTPFIQKGNALEYGCGPGPVLSWLLENKGFSVTRYDPFYFNDSEALKKSYDLITSTEVFEHFHHPLKSIGDVIKRLNKGGFLAIQTSFKEENDQRFLSWWYRRDLTHVSFYTLESFKVIGDHFDCELVYTNQKNIVVLKKR